MLLFVDESGQDHRETPYEVLAGVAIQESNLWALVRAVQDLEMELFGVRLDHVGVEMKGKKLLKHKIFRHAQKQPLIEDLNNRRQLCREFLEKGYRETNGGIIEPRTSHEFAAYGQTVLDFLRRIFALCYQYRVKVFASIVNIDSETIPSDILRKDYSYLFERFFYYLEDYSPSEMGLVVFDELEKAKCRILIGQMERYFSSPGRGAERSRLIIPEPFFVHSDLTTAIQLVDLIAYSINWGVRLRKMTKPTRPEIEEFGQLAYNLRYVGTRIIKKDEGPKFVYSIIYIDDLRPKNGKH